MTAAMFDPSPSIASGVLFTLGWVCGWVMLCRPRRLSGAVGRVRPPATVVVPARDEAHSIGALASAVVARLRDGDELIVVDDASTDATSEIAAAAGARVLSAPSLPDGWAGKPHACSVGAAAASGELLVFVDADVSPGDALVDAVCVEVLARPDHLVSVQPWHVPRGVVEQLSVMFNVTALMGSAAFTVFGAAVRTRVAFGPVMAISRSAYARAGGHGSPDVRTAILEDIALARAVGRTRLFIGRKGDVTFRMYPHGLASLVEGWTKGMGIGASATPRWALVATAAWVTSVAGGWLASPWFALASVAQLAVLARIAGRFHPLVIAVYPLATAFFAAIFVRSALRRAGRSAVTWKGRTLRPDQHTR